eukprot:CAMPEP_0173232126 /NCGR_PEP_ID=MMETSP1142-20121109/8791_1 /TAXON_ID=483371 /ORGANISM="non described non described, Strain CCMP2298" /LENGTH=69 /DNA_ID=CAMNT_0014161609 /DNA_START=823 /DNA_END=1032 /DNA_ORIENTATION=+
MLRAITEGMMSHMTSERLCCAANPPALWAQYAEKRRWRESPHPSNSRRAHAWSAGMCCSSDLAGVFPKG